MPNFTHTIDVAADPATAWEVLGDLAGVDRWIPGVTKVELDGMIRRCTFADGHTQHEASFAALDPAREDELRRMWAGMLPSVLGNLKALVEQRVQQR